jgi:hypothetical protein
MACVQSKKGVPNPNVVDCNQLESKTGAQQWAVLAMC